VSTSGQVLAAFAETAWDETDLDRLTGELVRVVEETMQPAYVSLWLRDIPGGSAQRRGGEQRGSGRKASSGQADDSRLRPK